VQGSLELPNTAPLVAKYKELLGSLDSLRPIQLRDLVDALLPSGNESCSVIREAALLELDELETSEDLLGCMRTTVTQPVIPEEVDYVRVMSLHKAKGLTSKVAIVAGCTHGLVPFVDLDETPDEAAATLQEQRRLFYVAITRCTETLVISSALRMARQFAWKIGARVVPRRGPIARTLASQFIDELGPKAPRARRGTEWAAAGYAE